jgi:hypothetical protein
MPTPMPIQYAGVPTASSEARWLDTEKLWLAVPHRTQFDNSFYAESNCGPTSLGMILEAYGLKEYRTDVLRDEVNRIQGNASPYEGTGLPALAAVGQRAGLVPLGLYARPGGYARWTLEDVRGHVTAGRPVIVLTRIADLPGARNADDGTNHYIVISGVSGDQFIYNDSAYPEGRGAGLLIPPDALRRAWERSMIPGHAVAFARDSDGSGLLHAVGPPTVAADLRDGEGEDPPLEALEDTGVVALDFLAEDMSFLVNFEDESLLLYPKLAMVIPAPISVPDSEPRPSFTQGALLIALAALLPYLMAIVIANLGQGRRWLSDPPCYSRVVDDHAEVVEADLRGERVV